MSQCERETSAQIARKANISPSFFCDIRKGRKIPSSDVASRLESATGKHRLHWLYPGQYDEHGQPVAQAQGEPEEAA